MHRDPSTTANKQGQLVNCSKAWITGHICALEMEKNMKHHPFRPIKIGETRQKHSKSHPFCTTLLRQPALCSCESSIPFWAVTKLSWLLLYKPGTKKKRSCKGKHHAQLINLHPKRKFCKVLGKVTPLRQSIESRLKVKH